MEYLINSILPCIVTLFTALGGAKFIMTKSEKKISENQAEKSALDNMNYVIDTLRNNMDSMDRRIYALSATNEKYFAEIQKHRDEKIALRDKIMTLEVEKEKLNSKKCEVKGCKNRRPPSESMM